MVSLIPAIPISAAIIVAAIGGIVALHWFRHRLKKKSGPHTLAHIVSILALLGGYGVLGLALLFGLFAWGFKNGLEQNLGPTAWFDGPTNVAFARGRIPESAITGAELV